MFEYDAMVEISLFFSWNMLMEVLRHLKYPCYVLRSYDASFCEALSEREREGGRERESCVIYSVIEPPRGLNLFSVSGFLNSQFLNNVQTSTYSHAYYLSNGLFYL